MRALSPLALCLLLAAGPALAGSDFCDGGGDGPIDPPGSNPAPESGTDPNASSCEVDMIVSAAAAQYGIEYWSLRDLPFTGKNLAVLEKTKEWPELPLELNNIQLAPPGDSVSRAGAGKAGAASQRPAAQQPPIELPPQRHESTFLEWSFRPTSGPQYERVLSLTVIVKNYGGAVPVLRADWLESPQAGWSQGDGTSLAPPVLASLSAVLVDAQNKPDPRIRLFHDGDQVRVGIGMPVQQWLSFPLPSAQWRPVRLRNGPLGGTALSEGMGLRVSWTSLPTGSLDQSLDDERAPSAPTPIAPRVD